MWNEVEELITDVIEAGGSLVSGYGANATNTSELNAAAAERIRLNNQIAAQAAKDARERGKRIENLFTMAGYIILGMGVIWFGITVYNKNESKK